MKQYLGVTVILVKDDQVLLGERINSYAEGMFGVPGGRVDEEESVEDCMKRELKEEVGVVPVEFRLVGVVKDWQETDFFVHFVFVCTKWQGEIQFCEPDKSEEWQWSSLENLPDDILPGHKASLRFLTEKEQTWLIEI